MKKVIVLLVCSIMILIAAEYNSPQETEYISLIGAALTETITDFFWGFLSIIGAYIVVWIWGCLRAIRHDDIVFPDSFMVSISMLLVCLSTMVYNKNKYVLIGMSLVTFFMFVLASDFIEKQFIKSFTFKPKRREIL